MKSEEVWADGGRSATTRGAARSVLACPGGDRSAVGRLGVVYKTNNNACYGVSIARYFLVNR